MSPALSPARRGVTSRPLDWRDIPNLVRLETELFPADAWSQATWWAELAARPRRSYLVLTDGDDLVGYAGADLGGALADVMTIAVAPTHRGLGYGQQLLSWLIDVAAGATHLMLEVRADNPAAIELYQRNEFAVVSVRRRYYQPGDVDALVMRRSLG